MLIYGLFDIDEPQLADLHNTWRIGGAPVGCRTCLKFTHNITTWINVQTTRFLKVNSRQRNSFSQICKKSLFILTDRCRNKYDRLRGWPYIHICRWQVLPIDASPLHWRRVRRQWRRLASIGAAARRFVRFLSYGEAKFPKMGDSLPRMPMNLHAKFDAVSVIFAGEIRNHTNT